MPFHPREDVNTPLQNTSFSPYCRPNAASSGWFNTTIELSSNKGTEDEMRKYVSKVLALLILIGVAQSLAACVIEDDHYDHYHHHYWHEDHWDHR